MQRTYYDQWFNITPETYAKRVLPLLVAPELEGRSGAMFNAKAHAILPWPAMHRSTSVR